MIRTKLVVCLVVLTSLAAAQSPSVAGRWLISTERFGTPFYFRLTLEQAGDKLTGNYRGYKLEGTLSGRAFHLVAKDETNNTAELTGTIANGVLEATDVEIFADDKDHPQTMKLTGTMVPVLDRTMPQRHEFTPTVYYRQISALNKPVLTINPGDTIHTTTVDAGGTDFNGVTRTVGGNPETGPFYVTGAMPGDVLMVHINKLTLNRDWAGSDDGLDESAMNSRLAVKMKDNGKGIRWHLDRTAGTGTPENPAEHLKHYTVPLRPMLGCISAAPSVSGQTPPGSGDSGGYGGNMDYNEITEGATVYLRVSNPGAFLYFGDGHAAQGDGELNGNALETSMDVDLTVDVIPNKRIGNPRVENAAEIITMGLQGSLDDAFKEATSDMASWLEEDYKLTPSEIAQVMGTAAEYHVSEVADRNSGVVLKIKKERLAGLGK